MLRTLGHPLVLVITTHSLCLFVALSGTGCGWQPASTIESIPADGDGTMPPSDDASGPESTPDDVGPNAPPQSEDGSGGDMPDNAYCDDVAGWDANWISLENQVLELVNQRRAEGADCGDAGTFGPAEPLAMNAALRCAARNHSMDMGVRDYFDHYTPEGLGAAERLDQSGYAGSMWAENIAWGYATPEAVVSGWMHSPDHCANIMREQLTETGIGYYEGSLWTQTFGRP